MSLPPFDNIGNLLIGSVSFLDELQIDYQFTFNLSKREDQYYTKINFRNTPNKQDIDADFQVTCSMLAKMNISYVKGEIKSVLYLVRDSSTSNY